PLLEDGGNARLLWAFELTHGTGVSYQAVTITAVRDWATWGAPAARGDPGMRDWRRHAGSVRIDVTAKLLLPAAWSPLQDAPLGKAARDEGTPALYLHDTGLPSPRRIGGSLAA